MKRLLLAWSLMACTGLFGAVYLIDGQRVEGEVHEEDGMKTLCNDNGCYPLDADAVCLDAGSVPAAPVALAAPFPAVAASETPDPSTALEPDGVATGICYAHRQGGMNEDEFIAFVRDAKRVPLTATETTERTMFDGMSWWWQILLAFWFGLAMNLTPCVLPMMPINLMIIGKSAVRGALYGLGIMLAYGLLGVLAAAGGMVFGDLQGSPWFNLAMAALFVTLGLSMLGLFMIDFSKRRGDFVSQRTKMNPAIFAFCMGVVSALLAGACVTPVLAALIVYTARLWASGAWYAVGLVFIFGMGMAAPWPFAGAGLQVLPKPGAWMVWVNRIFGVLLIGGACYYGFLAYDGFAARFRDSSVVRRTLPSGREELEISKPEAFSLQQLGLKSPVLVDCWAPWCKNCLAMDREVLHSERVLAEFDRLGMTVVRLRCEKPSELRSKPGFKHITGLPYFVIFEW